MQKYAQDPTLRKAPRTSLGATGLLAWLAALTGTVVACNPAATTGPAPEFPGVSGGTAVLSGGIAATGGATATGGVVIASGGAFSSGGNTASGGNLSGGGDAGVSSPEYVSVPTDVPCDVAQVLSDHCWECHNVQTNWSAPMSLVARTDFKAMGPITATEMVSALVKSRTHNSANPMPPSTRAPVSEEELQVLDAWIDGGLQPGSGNSCEVLVPGSSGGTGGTMGGEMLPNETCYQFLKHGGQTPDDTSAHPMDPGEDYINFYYKVPWTEPVVATRWRTIYDKTEILHHWLIYESVQSSSRDGQWNGGNTGAHPGAKLLAVWAVGGGDERFPPGVGLQMPDPGSLFEIEWHLYNTGTSTVMDRSGIEVCVVPRADVDSDLIAGVTWLGTEQLNIPAGREIEHAGVCTPSFKNGGPINIVKWMPHMHLAGRHMKTWLLRGDGSEEKVFDKGFQFDSQIMYDQDPPLVVNQGDRLHAQCTFRNDTGSTILFGESTNEEMCYQFAFAYPVGSLDGRFSLSLNGSNNTCLSNGPLHP